MASSVLVVMLQTCLKASRPVCIVSAFPIAVAAGAAAAQAGSPRSIDWHDWDSYGGWVTDGATGKPIEGAVVVAVWQIRGGSRSVVGGNRDIDIVRLEETLSDKDGRFHFAPLGAYTPPPGWMRDESAFPVLQFFKPGYMPVGRTRVRWKFGEEAHIVPNPPVQPRKEGWSREIQIYRYLTQPVSEARAMNPIYKRQTDEQKILDALMGFAWFLEGNVRRLDHDRERQRKAIASQWRAIVMADEEIRKYRKNHEWGTTALHDAFLEKRKKEGIR